MNKKVVSDNYPTRRGRSNSVDTHVGNRIKIRRNLLNISQEKLGEMLGISFQQVQKYELGINRVSASRLWDISQVLSVDISFFYEEMSDSKNKYPVEEIIHSSMMREVDPMLKEETIKLVRAFTKLRPDVAQYILSLMKEIAKSPTAL